MNTKILSAAFFTAILCACSSNSSTSPFDDAETKNSSSYSSSSYRDRDDYSSDPFQESSSSSEQSTYLTTYKTLYFALTDYEQLVSMDPNDTKKNHTKGDPEISFALSFKTASGNILKDSTGLLLDLKDTGSWTGTKSVVIIVPIGTETISVCPKVIDEDAFADDNYSSGYCYERSNVGLLDNNEKVYQSDSENKNCSLEWYWYLY